MKGLSGVFEISLDKEGLGTHKKVERKMKKSSRRNLNLECQKSAVSFKIVIVKMDVLIFKSHLIIKSRA